MLQALLDGKTVDAAHLSNIHRNLTFTCPTCGNRLLLVMASARRDNFFRHRFGESCVTSKPKMNYSPQEFDDFQRRSDINLLLALTECGDPQLLTKGQRNHLYACGFLTRSRKMKLRLTSKALELLKTHKQGRTDGKESK